MSAEREGVFPRRTQKFVAVERVEGDVWRAGMISTPVWTGTGFMKCVLITLLLALRSVGSCVVAAAISVMEMEDVFVARTAWGGQVRARVAKIERLSSTISGTASITMSTSPRSSILVEGVSRARAASASDCESFCFCTSLASSLSANARPLSRFCGEVSMTVTGTLAVREAVNAIPRPIWPAPTTPSLLISAGWVSASVRLVELRWRLWRLM